MAYPTATNRLRITKILDISTESPTVKTFTFEDEQCSKAEPGQFLMLWIPGVDEIPLSILEAEDFRVSVAVRDVGEATEALHNKNVGQLIGVRGPFGNSYVKRDGRILMVAGGTGIVPILFLANKVASKATELILVAGAETKNELLFMHEFKSMIHEEIMEITVTTEDGSYGVEGLVTDPLESLLEEGKFDVIYTCGPERMMRRVFDLAEQYGIALEASLERLMRCAIGLCGSCVIGKYRVCKDGPVFTTEQLRAVTREFGISKRDFDGRKIPL